MPTGIFEFGDFCLDCDRFELRRSTVPLRIERKPLELLILLASSGGRVVKRDEIARHLWPSGVFVDTEHGINTAVRKVRYVLHENAERPRFLETVPGKGYRFVGATAHTPTTAPLEDEPPLQVSSNTATLQPTAATSVADQQPMPTSLKQSSVAIEPHGRQPYRNRVGALIFVAGFAIAAMLAVPQRTCGEQHGLAAVEPCRR